MNEVTAEVVRTPQLIAAEINSIKDQTRKIMLDASIEIGRRLTEAKGMIEHGQWGAWLKESVNYSQSTAENLMRIFREYGADQLSLLGSEAKSQALGKLSVTQAVLMLGIPAEEREAFVAEHDVENMTTRELEEAIKEKKKLQEDLKKANDANSTLHNTLSDTRNTLKTVKDEADKLRNELKKAKEAGDPDRIGQLERDLEEAREKIRDFEEQAKQPLEGVVVEKIPEDIERKLAELQAIATMPESPIMVKFSIKFEALGKEFRAVLEALDEIRNADPAVFETYGKAVAKLIDNMSDRLTAMMPAAESA